MAPPTISVMDLTSQLGLYALVQLGAPHPSGYGHWPQIALGDAPLAPRFDWHRPPPGQVPPAPGDAAEAAVLIVGPGARDQLLRALPALERSALPRVWIYLTPSALMEELALQTSALQQQERTQIYRLPDSSPQTFWLVLLEQLHQFGMRDADPSSLPDTSLDPNHMTSNLKQSMDAAMTINGALAVALVDYRSGMCLAQAGGGFNLDLAAAGNTEVVRAKLKTVESLGLRKGIEDILITLSDQYHLIRLVPNTEGLFLYLVLDKEKGNLALARFKLTDIERSLRV